MKHEWIARQLVQAVILTWGYLGGMLDANPYAFFGGWAVGIAISAFLIGTEH